MQTTLLIIHVFMALGLIGIILIQQGKGADAGAAFGSGGSSTMFGARGAASFLTRTTAILAILFFTNSLALAYLSSKNSDRTSLMDQPYVEFEEMTFEKIEDDTAPPSDEKSGDASAEQKTSAAPASPGSDIPTIPGEISDQAPAISDGQKADTTNQDDLPALPPQ